MGGSAVRVLPFVVDGDSNMKVAVAVLVVLAGTAQADRVVAQDSPAKDAGGAIAPVAVTASSA